MKKLLITIIKILMIVTGLFLAMVLITTLSMDGDKMVGLVAVVICAIPFWVSYKIHQKLTKQAPTHTQDNTIKSPQEQKSKIKAFSKFDTKIDITDKVYSNPKEPKNLKISMEYKKSSNEISQRDVIVEKFNDEYFYGLCLMRNAHRTFKFDRVISCYDTNTGEIIEPSNLKKYLAQNDVPSTTQKLYNIYDIKVTDNVDDADDVIYNKDEVLAEVKEIGSVSKIKTPADLIRLEKLADKIEDLGNNADTGKEADRFFRLSNKMWDVYYEADRKPYKYYLKSDNMRIWNVTLELLRQVGKFLDARAYDKADEEHQRFFEKVRLSDFAEEREYIEKVCKEQINQKVADLTKALEIYYSDSKSKEADFNSLVKDSRYLRPEFFYEKNAFKAFDLEIKVKKLKGIPAAKKFIEAGYKNLAEIRKLSDRELLAINGIGPFKLEEIKEFLANSQN